MDSEFHETKVVCFDLGNTLIEFGPRQIALQYERFEPKPGDHEPDQRIAHISELRNLLLG